MSASANGWAESSPCYVPGTHQAPGEAPGSRPAESRPVGPGQQTAREPCSVPLPHGMGAAGPGRGWGLQGRVEWWHGGRSHIPTVSRCRHNYHSARDPALDSLCSGPYMCFSLGLAKSTGQLGGPCCAQNPSLPSSCPFTVTPVLRGLASAEGPYPPGGS